MLDPRIEDAFKEIEAIKKAILILASNLDGVTWRVSTDEEREAGIDLFERINGIVAQKNKEA